MPEKQLGQGRTPVRARFDAGCDDAFVVRVAARRARVHTPV